MSKAEIYLFVTLMAAGDGLAARLLDRVAAVVNDDIVLQSEVDQAVSAQIKTFEETDSPEAKKAIGQLQRKVLDDLVDAHLIEQQAMELKLNVTTEEVDRAQEEVRTQNKLKEEDFRAALRQQGFTMESYRKNLRRQILNLKVLRTAVQSRVSVSDDEVKTFYKQSENQGGDDYSVHFRQILLSLPEHANVAEIEKRRLEATRLLDEARAGKHFAELAKKYSEDAGTKASGGDMGWVNRGTLVEPLDKALEGMQPNEIRGPLRTEKGWYIFQVVEKKNGNLRPFEEVKDKLKQQLYEQQVEKATQSWLRELRRKAHVDIRL